MWWQDRHPRGRIYVNRTGWAQVGRVWLPFGIPAPGRRKGSKRRGGGGPDLDAYPGESHQPLIIKYEVKTLDSPRLDPNQVATCRQFESMGVQVWIVKELPEERDGLPWELVRFGLDF